MRVEISESAQRDLWAIVDWLAVEASAETALRIYDTLVADCLDLVPMPRRFPLIQDSGQADLRFRVSGRHLILYTIREDVVVLRVIDSAQDYVRFLDAL